MPRSVARPSALSGGWITSASSNWSRRWGVRTRPWPRRRLCSCSKKSPPTVGRPRGGLIDQEQRRHVSQLIDEACVAGARLDHACDRLGLSPRTLQRSRAVDGLRADGRGAATRGRIPANRLRENERAAILVVVNQPPFADRPPISFYGIHVGTRHCDPYQCGDASLGPY